MPFTTATRHELPNEWCQEFCHKLCQYMLQEEVRVNELQTFPYVIKI